MMLVHVRSVSLLAVPLRWGWVLVGLTDKRRTSQSRDVRTMQRRSVDVRSRRHGADVGRTSTRMVDAGRYACSPASLRLSPAHSQRARSYWRSVPSSVLAWTARSQPTYRHQCRNQSPSLDSVPPRPGSAIDFRLGHFQRVLSICQHQADASHCPSCSHHSFANAFTSTNSHPPDAHCAQQQTHHVPPDPFHTAPRLLARDRRAGRYRY